MLTVRLAEERDVEALLVLAASAGTGMTTVPTERSAMLARIAASTEAVAKTGRATAKDIFFFVAEQEGRVLGMASIFPALGEDRPFYSYRIGHLASSAPELDIEMNTDVLFLVNDYHGYTEIGTLLVDESLRGTGGGQLMSLSRFLFMKLVQDRLGTDVMAEIRGWFTPDGRSPFWDAIASRFFQLDFEEADRRSASDFRFIADLMPKYPIYTELLPREARDTIGRANDSSAPAKRLLERQGFRFRRCIDIFDGGPSMEAEISSIRTIREAQFCAALAADSEAQPGQRSIVSATDPAAFRATLVPRTAKEGHIGLSRDEMKALNLEDGAPVLAATLPRRKAR